MTTSQTSPDYPVYLGVWTNWSLGGRITGSTITLSHRNGALLTAFIAIFITFIGSRSWRIFCFISHQLYLRTSTEAQDGLYHQRQAILRNTTDEKTGLLNLFQSMWTWRRRADRALHRMLPIITLSLLITVFIAFAGIFSSRISSSMGNEVLISSPNCGIPLANLSAESTVAADKIATILDPWTADKITSYANYAQTCYSNASREGNCVPFIRPKLSSFVNRDADCPFKRKICRREDGNIRLDTGYLNSQNDLGLNTPEDSRFDVRIAHHCAPLETQGFQKLVDYTPDKPYVKYYYGGRTKPEEKSAETNLTFEAQQQSVEELSWQRFSAPIADYMMGLTSSAVYNGSFLPQMSSFIPIEELTQIDGDLTLIFLSANGVRYSRAVNDDWYSAHQSSNRNLSTDLGQGTIPFFFADEPASVLGCKSQYQTCYPTSSSTPSCSPWSGIADRAFYIDVPRTRRERAIYWTFRVFELTDVLQTLRASSLTSRFRLKNNVQAPLPDNQWHLDVEYWHNIVVSGLQGLRVGNTIGPEDPDMLKYIWARPSNEEQKYLCANQKIISTAYTNFSLMWVIIVLSIGIMIIALESTQESIFVWLERRGTIKISCAEWFSNNTLQLQRMAHEEVGAGDWSGCTGPRTIPVTEKGQLLGILDLTNPDHPRLKTPGKRSANLTNILTLEGSGSQEGTTDSCETDINVIGDHAARDSDSLISMSTTHTDHHSGSGHVAAVLNSRGNDERQSTTAISQENAVSVYRAANLQEGRLSQGSEAPSLQVQLTTSVQPSEQTYEEAPLSRLHSLTSSTGPINMHTSCMTGSDDPKDDCRISHS